MGTYENSEKIILQKINEIDIDNNASLNEFFSKLKGLIQDYKNISGEIAVQEIAYYEKLFMDMNSLPDPVQKSSRAVLMLSDLI